MLELKNVSKYYNNNGVVTLGLRNINLQLNKGEIVAVVGDSGSGKSTLLNVITAVDTYEEGEIYFEGNETSYFNQNDMDVFRKNNVSFIFQNYNIIDSYTVLENVMIPLLLRGKTKEEAKTKALEIIERVGLKKRTKHKGTKLSGGEKQRCVIARALASDSKILACDEPTGNLDSKTGEEIIRLIKEVAEDRLVLIVTHNYNQVKDIVTRRIKVADGEIVEDLEIVHTESSETNEELNLEEAKMKKKTFLQIAWQNIISTPKKTIFTSLVLFIVSFAILTLCLLLFDASYEVSGSDERYGIITDDRLVTFDLEQQGLEKSILEKTSKKSILYNGFYEELTFNALQGNITGNLNYTAYPLKYRLVEGKAFNNSNDCLIVIPKARENSYYNLKDYINRDLYFYYRNIKTFKIGTVRGLAVSEEVTKPYLIKKELDQRLVNAIIFASTTFYYNYSGEKRTLNVAVDTSRTSYISCPKSLEGSFSYEGILSDMYPVVSHLEIVYRDSEDSPLIVFGEDAYNGQLVLEFAKIYESTIYTNNPNEVKRALEKQGYVVTLPAKSKNVPQFNLITFYLFLFMIIIALMCSLFITYVVLSRVYASKNKDYGVLRTLGMIKPQLGKIVVLEVISLGIFNSALSFILFLILKSAIVNFPYGKHFNFWIICLYFMMMLIFSYFLARRFNRRLYKFSVNTTLKGEVARND